MTPGAYLRDRRLAAGLSIEDLALCLETVPYRVSVAVRADWLAAIEDGVVDLTLSTALALADVPPLAVDLDELAVLSDAPMSFRFVAAQTLGEAGR